VDNLGRVYVIDSGLHDMQTFGSSGEFLNRAGGRTNSKTPGRFLSPNGVAVDPLGNLYIADTGNVQLQAFLTQDEYETRWQSDFDPAINPFDRSTTVVHNQNYPLELLQPVQTEMFSLRLVARGTARQEFELSLVRVSR